MMKFKVVIGILGIIVLLLGAYVGITLTRSSAHASQTSGPIGMPHLSQTKPKTVGIPAIIVENPTKQVMANTPRISKVDVENYVKIHQFQGGPIVAGTTPKVTMIDYITSKEASQRLKNDSIGLADTAMVYYVKWQGSFNLTSVSAPPRAVPFKPASEGVEIFDAHTGNLLLWWVPTN